LVNTSVLRVPSCCRFQGLKTGPRLLELGVNPPWPSKRRRGCLYAYWLLKPPSQAAVRWRPFSGRERNVDVGASQRLPRRSQDAPPPSACRVTGNPGRGRKCWRNCMTAQKVKSSCCAEIELSAAKSSPVHSRGVYFRLLPALFSLARKDLDGFAYPFPGLRVQRASLLGASFSVSSFQL
jgi:hypothetical protein